MSFHTFALHHLTRWRPRHLSDWRRFAMDIVYLSKIYHHTRHIRGGMAEGTGRVPRLSTAGIKSWPCSQHRQRPERCLPIASDAAGHRCSHCRCRRPAQALPSSAASCARREPRPRIYAVALTTLRSRQRSRPDMSPARLPRTLRQARGRTCTKRQAVPPQLLGRLCTYRPPVLRTPLL